MKRSFLLLVILLGLGLRIVGLSDHPAGFTPDEASFGYDAYSLLKTGKDQWGASIPLVFKSFGDYKLPVYTYLAVPSVAIFGLNEVAVRLPSALLGSLAVLVTYFLVKELWKREDVALFSSFLLAISPWHMPLSRGAFEANLTTFFLPLGICLFLKGLKNSRFLVLAFLVFGVNMFTYHTARLLTPLVVGFLVFNYKVEFLKSRLWKAGVFIFAVFFAIAGYFYIIGGSRIATSGIFSESNNGRYLSVLSGQPDIIARVFNNKFVYTSQTFLRNYVSYFSPQFLFTNGPAEGTYGMVPGVGVVYLIEVAFLTSFIISMIKKGMSRESVILLFWILISPIPAALTKGPGYAANRAAFMMPALQIISAIGAIYLFGLLAKRISKKTILGGAVMVFAVSFAFFVNSYFVKQKMAGAGQMLYGAKEVFEYVDKEGRSDNQIIVSRAISEPQIYTAFYLKIDPGEFQKASESWRLTNGWLDQSDNYKLGKYTFKSIDGIADFKPGNFLVGRPADFSPDVVPTKIVYYPSQSEAYWIVNNR